MGRPTAARRPLNVGRDDDTQPLGPLADTDHTHARQADQQRAHARSIRFQAGAPRDSRLQTSLRIAEPLCRARDPTPDRTPPSDPKRQFRPARVLPRRTPPRKHSGGLKHSGAARSPASTRATSPRRCAQGPSSRVPRAVGVPREGLAGMRYSIGLAVLGWARLSHRRRQARVGPRTPVPGAVPMCAPRRQRVGTRTSRRRTRSG
jgi:hypothetical protein